MLGVAAALLLGAGSVRAQGAPEEPPEPAWGTTRMRVTVAPGHARVRVSYQVMGDSDSGWLTRTLSLPAGGVVAGLRMQEGSGWISGNLRAHDDATEAFLGLPGLEKQSGAGRALLEWESSDSLLLQLFPVMKRHSKEIELTVLAPTRYEQGRDILDLGPLAQGPVELRVASADGPTFVDEHPVGASERVKGRAGAMSVAMERRSAPPLGGRYAEADAGGKALLRLRIEAARRVAEVPSRAGVVVLLDASRSMPWPLQQDAAHVARDYLKRHPDARASVLRFDRTVRPLLDGLAPAQAVVEALARSTPGQRNGSRADLALEEAARLLKEYPGPRRVLMLTDGHVRSALEVKALRRLAEATGAVVHLGIVSTGQIYLHRHDEHEWAEAARATGGLVWTVGASGRPEALGAYEALARPTSVDSLRVRALSHDAEFRDEGWPWSLAEGEGFEVVKTASAAGGFEVQGELWSRPVRVELKPSAAESAVWTSMAVGAPDFLSLSDAEQRVVAARARVVSPTMSLLALGPGPLGDLREQGSGMLGYGRSGSSYSSPPSIGIGPRSLHPKSPDVKGAVEVAWRRCTGGRGSAEVSLELTLREVVDVASVEVKQAPDGARACLEQALWELDFPDHHVLFARFDVQLPLR